MYIPVTKSCAVRGAGCPGDYKRNNATANMLLDMGDDKLQSAIQKQVGVQCLHFYLSLHISVSCSLIRAICSILNGLFNIFLATAG